MTDGHTKKIGVIDVAKHAGVSIGTVSNYLNYPDRVSTILKQRISASITELGYVPRRAQSAIQDGGGHRLIGYVMTEVEHSLFTDIFEGIQEVCEDNDMEVIAANAISDRERQSRLVSTFCEMDVRGILLSTVLDSEEDIAIAHATGKPIILIDHRNPLSAQPACQVLENNVSVGQLAAEELITSGCRRLAFASHSFDYQAIQDRHSGVRKAVERTKGAVTLELINTQGILYEDGRALGAKLNAMDRDHVPDGIVAGTDWLGAGIIVGLAGGGRYRVPQDIRVIGTEGMRLSETPSVPLSTVDAPGVDMGRTAMSQLLDEIENSGSHVHNTTLLEPKVHRRASTTK